MDHTVYLVCVDCSGVAARLTRNDCEKFEEVL